MDTQKYAILSKKFGVGGGTIGGLTYLGVNAPEHTLYIAVMMTVLAACYLCVQGYIDSKEVGR